jgi:hypothetical protein
MHPSVSRRTFLSKTPKATLAAAALPVAAASGSSRPGGQADGTPPAKSSEKAPPSALAAAGAPLAEFRFHNDDTLGTSLDLTVVCRHKAQSEAALKVVLDEIERLRKILSTRDPESEISRLAAATGPVKPGPYTIRVEAVRSRKTGRKRISRASLRATRGPRRSTSPAPPWSKASRSSSGRRLPNSDRRRHGNVHLGRAEGAHLRVDAGGGARPGK